jgi:hypothetical protein
MVKLFLTENPAVLTFVASWQALLMRKKNPYRELGWDSDSLRAMRSSNRIPLGARLYVPVQTCPRAHIASYVVNTGSLSRGYSGRVEVLTTHSYLAPRLKKEHSYTTTRSCTFTACCRVDFTFLLLIVLM